MLQHSLRTTHAATHTTYSTELVQAFELAREGEEEAAGGSSSEAITSAVRLPAFPENTQTSSPLPARMESSEDLSMRAVPEPSAEGE